jgi:hypothetical protein
VDRLQSSQSIIAHAGFWRPEATERVTSKHSHRLPRLSCCCRQSIASSIAVLRPVRESIERWSVELVISGHENRVGTISIRDYAAVRLDNIDDAVGKGEERIDPPAMLIFSDCIVQSMKEYVLPGLETQTPNPSGCHWTALEIRIFQPLGYQLPLVQVFRPTEPMKPTARLVQWRS